MAYSTEDSRNLLDLSYHRRREIRRIRRIGGQLLRKWARRCGHQKYIIYSTNFGGERCSYDAHRLYMWLALDGEPPAIWTAPRQLGLHAWLVSSPKPQGARNTSSHRGSGHSFNTILADERAWRKVLSLMISECVPW
jgi:hypothetical protein